MITIAGYFREFWALWLDSPGAEDMVRAMKYRSKLDEMISVSVINCLDGDFKHGDPCDAAFEVTSLEGDDLEMAILCTPEYIEDRGGRL